MNSGYMIIYKKNNNDIIYRTTRHRPEYNKGDLTSMGWLVLDIQRLYKGKTYTYLQYDDILKRRKIRYNITEYIRKNIINILRIIILLLVIYVILKNFIFL